MTPAGPDGSARLAYDLSGLAKLKHEALTKPASTGAKRAAAQDFEALFLQRLLSSMRKAVVKSKLLGNTADDKIYQDMLDAQWAQMLARRGGIGIASMIERQLTPRNKLAMPPKAAPIPLARSHASPVAAPRDFTGLQGDTSVEALINLTQATQPLMRVAPVPLIPRSPGNVADAQAAAPARSRTAHVHNFMKRMSAPALETARRTGLPPQLILAQAALETGWGRSEITADDGTSTFNVFGIKASGWSGQTARATTHEFEDGVQHTQNETFRAYDSYAEAFADYGRLIANSPRYAGVVRAAAESPEAAAQALQDAGYATDPQYANKLIAIMRSLPPLSPATAAANRDGAPLVEISASAAPLF